MSGGSLSYLYIQDDIGTEDIWKIDTALEYLEENGQELSKAYSDLVALRETLESAREQKKELEKVLHAIEWTISCDWGEDQLLEVLKKHDE